MTIAMVGHENMANGLIEQEVDPCRLDAHFEAAAVLEQIMIPFARVDAMTPLHALDRGNHVLQRVDLKVDQVARHQH